MIGSRATMFMIVWLGVASVACDDSEGRTSDELLPVGGDSDAGTMPATDAAADAGELKPSDDGGGLPELDGAVVSDAGPDDVCAKTRLYQDADQDGYGDPDQAAMLCDPEPGYVTDGTDCDDKQHGVNPGAEELCDQVDQDCDAKVDGAPEDQAACAGLAGTYSGPFVMHTSQSLNNLVINDMLCSGTASLTVDVGSMNTVTGSAICERSKGPFATEQFSTIKGTLRPDGTVSGTLHHEFASDTEHTFKFTGSIGAEGLTVDIKDTWLPNPADVQDWEADASIRAPRE